MITDELEKENIAKKTADEEIKKDEIIDEKSTEDIQNIELPGFTKRKFSINGDTSKIIELDLNDLSIVNRVEKIYPVLEDLADEVAMLGRLDESDERELLSKTAAGLKEVDAKMRQCVDDIFDFPVCQVVAPIGSMYDPINGKFRYEHIVETLINLYSNNLNKEIKKIQNKVSKHTNKYTKKR